MASASALEMWVPWLSTITLELLIAGTISLRGYRQWQIVQALCIFSASKSLLLIAFYLLKMYGAYFYTFWIAQCIVYCIGLAVMAQLMQFVSSGFVHFRSVKARRCAILACMLGCFIGALAAKPHASIPHYVMGGCLYLSRFTSISSLFLLVVAVWALEFSGAAWKRAELGVLAGIALMFAADAGWSLWIEMFGLHAQRYDSLVRDSIIMAADLVWLVTFTWTARPVPFIEVNAMELT